MAVWFSLFALLFSVLTYINTRRIRTHIEGTQSGVMSRLWGTYGYIIRNGMIALAIVFLFANVAAPGSKSTLRGSVMSSLQLLQQIVTGAGIPQPDPGLLSVQHMWYSVRLAIFALIFSILIGSLLATAEFRVRWRFGRWIIRMLTTALESLPDAIYIIVSVVIVLYVWLRLGINIPVFGSWNPGVKDTMIPALIISLPPAFYLNRIIQMRAVDERGAAYIQTAIAKGATSSRVFYVHLLPNLVPTVLRQIPVAAVMILSTLLFAETFMQFNGQLGRFTQAVAMNSETGTELYNGWTPEYHVMAVFGIGAFLVVLWVGIRLIADIFASLTSSAGVPMSTVSGRRLRPQWTYVAVGAGLLLIVVFFGAFPQVLTHYNPHAQNLGSVDTTMPPFPPSAKHPFGTDTFGRDLLSRVLHGTFPSLVPACLITAAVTICAFLLCLLIISKPAGRLSRLTKTVSEIMSAVPVLFILILAMYQRNTSGMHEALYFILWVAAFELGRGAYAFYQTVDTWYSMAFVEGAIALGRNRLSILFTHLRMWLWRYMIEFVFTEFVRVAALMAQLAAFHIYVVERIGLLPFKPFGAMQWPEGIVTGSLSWFGMLGGATMNLSYLSYPFFLYGPVLALAVTLIGANFVARGLRGR